MDIKTGKDLFELIIGSQVKAFTEFYNQFFKKLILAADKHVKDTQVAEEIVQDVFLKIWESPENLEKILSLKSYLYRSVINASINYVNRQKSIDEHHKKIALDFTDEYLIELDEENELIILLHLEIEKLPAQCKKIFKLNRFEHLKYKQIASILGISERTVENHIANALRILRKALLDNKVVKKPSSGYNLILSLYLF